MYYKSKCANCSSSEVKLSDLKRALKDENIVGVLGTVGAVTKISIARLAVEYNFAKVYSLSFKIGVNL